MIGLVLVTHGRLADEFRSALEHVVGPQEAIATISIAPEDDVESRRGDILKAVAQVDGGQGVVILDMPCLPVLLTQAAVSQTQRKIERGSGGDGIHLPCFTPFDRRADGGCAIRHRRQGFVHCGIEPLGEPLGLCRLPPRRMHGRGRQNKQGQESDDIGHYGVSVLGPSQRRSTSDIFMLSIKEMWVLIWMWVGPISDVKQEGTWSSFKYRGVN